MTIHCTHPQNDDSVITDRGGIPETLHRVHAAVVSGATGRLLARVGDPSRLTLARSAAKPAQALAILETPGADALCRFAPEDVALLCASHSSEPRHVARAAALLDRAGAAETEMRCGGHAALSPAVNRAWARAGFEPTPVYSNCSGKHAGMLAGARALGADPATYHLPEHPMQQRVRAVVEDLCGLPSEDIRWAVDGCNLPAPAAPLAALARMYASFAAAADAVDKAQEEVTERQRQQARVFDAMARHGDMVGGEARFCTEFAAAYGGAAVGKLGAEGVYGVAVRASGSVSTGSSGLAGEGEPLGLVVKVEDGNIAVLYGAVVEILRRLRVGPPRVWEESLKEYHSGPRRNTVGVEVGGWTYAFELKRYG